MSWISAWGIIRAAGITAYIMLFLSVLFGMFYYGKLLPNKVRAVLLPLHQVTGWSGFLFGLAHGVTLYVDGFMPFTLHEIFIPFTAKFRPLTSGLGTITLYLYLLLLLSSDFKKKIGQKLWRSIHYIAFPAFVFATIHGFFTGTDSKFHWARVMYLTTLSIFIVAVIIRILIQGGEPEKAKKKRYYKTVNR